MTSTMEGGDSNTTACNEAPGTQVAPRIRFNVGAAPGPARVLYIGIKPQDRDDVPPLVESDDEDEDDKDEGHGGKGLEKETDDGGADRGRESGDFFPSEQAEDLSQGVGVSPLPQLGDVPPVTATVRKGDPGDDRSRMRDPTLPDPTEKKEKKKGAASRPGRRTPLGRTLSLSDAASELAEELGVSEDSKLTIVARCGPNGIDAVACPVQYVDRCGACARQSGGEGGEENGREGAIEERATEGGGGGAEAEGGAEKANRGPECDILLAGEDKASFARASGLKEAMGIDEVSSVSISCDRCGSTIVPLPSVPEERWPIWLTRHEEVGTYDICSACLVSLVAEPEWGEFIASFKITNWKTFLGDTRERASIAAPDRAPPRCDESV